MIEKNLNAPQKKERLAALRELISLHKSGESETPAKIENINNHIHTTYSFSPYSPTGAVYTAWKAGLATAGIMDHDSMAGAREFIEAGKIANLAVTIGFEFRCDMSGTPFNGKKFNNPDQASVAYFAVHGVPHAEIDRAEDFLRPFREKRNVRNRAMTDNANRIFLPHGIKIDFDADVIPVSNYNEGGGVTDRHILYALSKKIIEAAGRGEKLINFLEKNLGINVSGGNLTRIMDTDNEMYVYFLLNILRGQLTERFYVPATDECPPVFELLAFADEIGAIAAYPYLGDVTDSVTGDKKTQRLEDEYLDDYIKYLKKIGVNAVTFMPTRNTASQLARVMNLCDAHDMFQICGEDINSPFQSFICEALVKPEFKHLIESAWALVGHENSIKGNGIFSKKIISKTDLQERIKYFAEIGKKTAAY